MRDDIHLHWIDYHGYPALRGEIMTGQLPKVISQSEMQIVPGLTITVMVLDNGKRIIPAEDMRRACEWLGMDLADLLQDSVVAEQVKS